MVLAVLPLCFAGVRLVMQVRRLTRAERATAAATYSGADGGGAVSN